MADTGVDILAPRRDDPDDAKRAASMSPSFPTAVARISSSRSTRRRSATARPTTAAPRSPGVRYRPSLEIPDEAVGAGLVFGIDTHHFESDDVGSHGEEHLGPRAHGYRFDAGKGSCGLEVRRFFGEPQSGIAPQAPALRHHAQVARAAKAPIRAKSSSRPRLMLSVTSASMQPMPIPRTESAVRRKFRPTLRNAYFEETRAMSLLEALERARVGPLEARARRKR